MIYPHLLGNCAFLSVIMNSLLENVQFRIMAKRYMANYEITEGHSILIMSSTATNKVIVLLLSYIMTPNVQYDDL